MISPATIHAGEGRAPLVDEGAHHVGAPRQQDQRDERERDAEREHDLAHDERVGRVHADREHDQGGRHRDEAPQRQRDLTPDEALHDDLARVGADARRGEARREQRERERERRLRAHQLVEAVVGALDRVDPVQRRLEEERRGDDQHRHVDEAGDPHRDRHVEALEAQQRALLVVVARPDAVLRERGVQVDDVRHHGRAEDAAGEQDAVAAVEARDEALRRLAGDEADLQRVVEEAEQDDPEQERDRDLEAPVAAALQAEHAERDDGGDQRRPGTAGCRRAG